MTFSSPWALIEFNYCSRRYPWMFGSRENFEPEKCLFAKINEMFEVDSNKAEISESSPLHSSSHEPRNHPDLQASLNPVWQKETQNEEKNSTTKWTQWVECLKSQPELEVPFRSSPSPSRSERKPCVRVDLPVAAQEVPWKPTNTHENPEISLEENEEIKEKRSGRTDPNFIVNSIFKSRGKNYIKQRRWGKPEDRVMVAELHRLCNQMGISVDALYKEPKEVKACRKHLFEELVVACGWRNDVESLVKRVHMLASMQEFSVRETRLLK